MSVASWAAPLTAIGSAFAVAALTVPMEAAAAPVLTSHACGYGADPVTSTSASVSPAMAVHGTRARVNVQVSSSDLTPTGSVSIRLRNPSGSVRSAWSRELNDRGRASVSLPTNLPARATFGITVAYNATHCFRDSSDGASYTVFRAGTVTDATAPNRSRRQRPVVRLSVDPEGPADARGRASVVVKKRGRTVRSDTVSLSDGSARATFRRLRPGYYTAVVRYQGNRNFTASTDVDGFRVTRR